MYSFKDGVILMCTVIAYPGEHNVQHQTESKMTDEETYQQRMVFWLVGDDVGMVTHCVYSADLYLIYIEVNACYNVCTCCIGTGIIAEFTFA